MFLKLDANILYNIANILILVAALRFFLFKPVTKMMDARQKAIADSLDEAQAQKNAAAALEKQHAAALDNAQMEAAQIVKDAQVRAAQESARLMAQAQADAAKLLADAQKQALADREKLLLDARGQIAGLALLAGAKLAQHEVNAETGSACVESFLAEVGVGA